MYYLENRPKDWQTQATNIVDCEYPQRLLEGACWLVRLEVAAMGQHLEILAHDKAPHVRKAVAEQGKHLDILVHDTHWKVRLTVAKKGKHLSILLQDDNLEVRNEAFKQAGLL